MQITLDAPWSYHTIPLTIDYPAGTHEVSAEVHAAAVKAGVHTEKETTDGDGDSTPRKARPSRKA